MVERHSVGSIEAAQATNVSRNYEGCCFDGRQLITLKFRSEAHPTGNASQHPDEARKIFFDLLAERLDDATMIISSHRLDEVSALVNRVVEMDIVGDPAKEKLLTVTEKGLGKATLISEYRETHRGAGGVKTLNVTAKTGKVVGAKVLPPKLDADLLLISKRGHTIRMDVNSIPLRGRATQGVILMRVKNDSVASVSLLEKTPEAIAEAIAEVSGAVEKILNGSAKKILEPKVSVDEAVEKMEKAAEKADIAKLVKAAKKDITAQKKEKKPAEKKKADDKKGKTAIKKATKKAKK